MVALDLFRDRGKPVLRSSVVLYLDVLGTTEASRSTVAQAILQRLDAALSIARASAMAGQSDETQALTWFSDNVFVAWPIQPGFDEEMGIALAVRAATYLQLMLVLKGGFLSRGGIAFGDIHMSESFAFGPALIEAHEIEQRMGGPRVGLSVDAVAEARKAAVAYADPRQAFGEELMLDHQGTAFVDYLGYSWTDDPDEFVRIDAAAAHRKVVADSLVQIPASASWRSKWEWAAEYHDFVCARYWSKDTSLQIGQTQPSFRSFQ
jgi:hypothetical protein